MKDVAVAILLREGNVLACQRQRNARYALKWEFPGGKLEAGESAEQALVRELQEELAITPAAMKEFFRQEWVYTEGTDTPQRDGAFRVFYFLVEHFSGEPVNHAFEQILWTSPRVLRTMEILEGNREAVERLIHYVEQHEAA